MDIFTATSCNVPKRNVLKPTLQVTPPLPFQQFQHLGGRPCHHAAALLQGGS